ncbi:amidohydrolase family protein [Costertonia aggregata]|uniref:Amidohydrolase family protein n=1 Tax=Costertonia aggregata TaxID=343403 RepID=A0A7H9AP09_9FLAO|nr:amidohydrolase family protein [Costertonia aggregata]QLG45005.1 amidohydrolase family protein [Costertonia aggregata]
MKNYPKIIAFLYVWVFIACQPKEALFEDAICIQNISTIDPIEGLTKKQTIVIKDGKIHKIVDSADLLLSKENTIIDGSGKYLIPGLWDTHVHFAYIEELAPRMFDMFLTHGITSVRDTGGKVDFVKKWKDKALANPTDAPRVMMAGPLLDGQHAVYDGSKPNLPELGIGLKDVASVKEKAKMLLSKKVDLFKAYEMLTSEQLSTICKIASANDIKVTGHIPLSMNAISASNSGMNSMEHMRNLDLSCASNSDELLAERQKLLANESNLSGSELRAYIHGLQQEKAMKNYDDKKATEVLAVFKKNDTWQIPTLTLNTLFSGKYFADAEYQKSYLLLPDSIADYWFTRSNVLKDYPVSEKSQLTTEFNYKMVKKIHEKGIPIMAGTDTPIAYLTPGLSLHEELSSLVKAGVSPLEVLKTATYNPAKYFNMENELGSIKENMWADLVILDANPLENISNTKAIHAVIKQGKLYNPKMLTQMLTNLRDN